MYYTYILKSKKDGQLYAGSTNNLRLRFEQHKKGAVPATKHRRPLELIYYEACLTEADARRRERTFKSYRGKMFLKNRLKSYFTGLRFTFSIRTMRKFRIIIILISILAGFLIAPPPARAGLVIKLPSSLGLATNLQGYWTFDGADMYESGTVAADKSGNGNNGTLTNGPQTTLGKIGQALSFDGSDDHVLANQSSITDFPFTLSVWAKSPTVSAKHALSYASSASLVIFYGIGFIGSDGLNKAYLYSRASAPEEDTVIGTTGFATGQWIHLVGVFNSATDKRIYANGVLEGTLSTSISFAQPNRVGVGVMARSTLFGYWNGSIDEARIYNRALAAAEVKELYNQGAGLMVAKTQDDKITTGLVGYWPFNGPDIYENGTVAADKSGNGNNGTLTNGPQTVLGKLGQALSFDGVNDYVQIYTTGGAPSGLIFQTAPFSVSFWIKSPNNSDWHSDFLISSRRNYGYTFQHRSDGSLRWLLNDAGGIDYIDASGVLDDTWHHVVGLRDGTNVRMYVDSVEKTPVTDNGRDVYDESTPPALRFGVDGASIPASFHGGLIDDVRIYNRALSQSEIKQLYNMGR